MEGHELDFGMSTELARCRALIDEALQDLGQRASQGQDASAAVATLDALMTVVRELPARLAQCRRLAYLIDHRILLTWNESRVDTRRVVISRISVTGGELQDVDASDNLIRVPWAGAWLKGQPHEAFDWLKFYHRRTTEALSVLERTRTDHFVLSWSWSWSWRHDLGSDRRKPSAIRKFITEKYAYFRSGSVSGLLVMGREQVDLALLNFYAAALPSLYDFVGADPTLVIVEYSL
jgi:hypothetical protein